MSGAKRKRLDLAAAAVDRPAAPVAAAVQENEATAATPPPPAKPAAPKAQAPAKPEPKAEPVHSARLNVPVTPDARQAFNILKAETGKQGPELMAEALNLLFRKYGKDQVS